jgi:hypothetical protein
MPPKKKKEYTGGEIINYYEVIPKDLIPKIHNPNEHLHGFKLPFRMCVSAPSGSGKSNFLMNMIGLFCNGNGTFGDITLCVRNSDEPLYNYLKGKSDQIQIKEGLHNTPILDKMDKRINHLVVFDDMVLNKDQSIITNFYIRARKLNCSVIYLSQSYFDIPSMIRKNCSYMVFLKLGGIREIKDIMRNFSLDCSKEQLLNMYNYATDEKLSPFIIDVESNDEDKKFRKGFKEYMSPDDFKDDENKD